MEIPYMSKDLTHKLLPSESLPAGSFKISILVLTFLMLVIVGRIQEIVPGLQYISLGKIALGLAVTCYMMTTRCHDFYLFSFPQIKYLMYLFALGFCSTLFSYWPSESLKFMLFSFAANLFMIFFLIKIIGAYEELGTVLWGLMVPLMILAVVALSSGGEGRASASATYDPNDLALVMISFLPLFFYMMQKATGVKKLLLFGVNSVLLAAMLATQSRSGFVAFCVVTAIILIRERARLIKIIFGGIIVVLVLYFVTPVEFWARMKIVGTEQDYNMSEGGGRLEIWKRGLGLVVTHPIFGVGPNAFPVAEGTTHVDELTGNTGKWSTAHSSYLLVAGEFGIPGLILYVLLIISSIRSLRRVRTSLREDSDLLWLCKGLEVSLYGFMTAGLFLSQTFSSAFFLLIGFSVVTEILAAKELHVTGEELVAS
jgi:O-antigen ligase